MAIRAAIISIINSKNPKQSAGLFFFCPPQFIEMTFERFAFPVRTLKFPNVIFLYRNGTLCPQFRVRRLFARLAWLHCIAKWTQLQNSFSVLRVVLLRMRNVTLVRRTRDLQIGGVPYCHSTAANRSTNVAGVNASYVSTCKT